MKFQLPQFIETEVKLVGPFTLKQFLWIAGGTSMLFVLFLIIHGIWFFVLAIPIAAASISLAFAKIDGVPLINYLSYMLAFYLTPKKYLYQNEKQDSLPINTNTNG
jgi:hypothetical protein